MTKALRIAKIASGFLLLGAGIVMIALPGPGWLTIAAGLAVLAGEYLWARRLLERLKAQAARLRRPRPSPTNTSAGSGAADELNPP